MSRSFVTQTNLTRKIDFRQGKIDVWENGSGKGKEDEGREETG
jgi:hypothetical protein